MRPSDATIGARVLLRNERACVPIGTVGVIIDEWGSGITVAWDLPERPYPYDLPPSAVARLPANNPLWPERDGFYRGKQLDELALIMPGGTEAPEEPEEDQPPSRECALAPISEMLMVMREVRSICRLSRDQPLSMVSVRRTIEEFFDKHGLA